MTALNIDLLRKVWAMAERGTPGEQAAARSRAESMVRSHGKTLADIPEILRGRTDHSSQMGINAYLDADVDRRFEDVWRETMAGMSPEKRAAAEAVREWMRGGVMRAQMQWQSLSKAQRAMLIAMADPATTVRRRAKGTIFDLYDAAGRLIAAKIGMEGSICQLSYRGLVRQESGSFSITPSGQEILRHRDTVPPKGPYE